MSNFTEELKTSITQRIDSSVMGTYTISFLIFNWKILIYAFDGDLSADLKIEKICETLSLYSFLIPFIFMLIVIIWYPSILEFAKGPTRRARIESTKRDIENETEMDLYKKLNGEVSMSLIEALIYQNKNQTSAMESFCDSLKAICGNDIPYENKIQGILKYVSDLDIYKNSVMKADSEIGHAYHLALGLTSIGYKNDSNKILLDKISRIKAQVRSINRRKKMK